MISTQGLSLYQMTPIVGVFLQYLHILERTIKRKIGHSNRACDAKFKKTMFNNTFREKSWILRRPF